ncbi:MAG: BdbC [Parcubacteria group bacterium GW2011_GWA2_47_10b]|nr:MAG: BdbC [Parcubacteria group bacterium GW2011_GWA2_47_10b]
MSSLALLTTRVLSLGTIALEIVSIVIFLALVARKEKFLRIVRKHTLLIGFLVSFGSVVASMYYSNIVGFTPCTLCWVQRIFLYPQALIFGIALFKRDFGVADYILGLSIVGGAVALYHTYIQFGGAPLVPCSAEVISCSQRFFVEFGYITIPTMSLSAFVLIALCMVALKRVPPVLH